MGYTTTPALVLHRTRYSDRYSIVHLYSREIGYVGTLVPETSSRNNAVREHLRPLAEVEITLSLSPQRDLARIQEVIACILDTQSIRILLRELRRSS